MDKVNEGFEGDQKTLVKEKAVSLEEGLDGDEGVHKVTVNDDGGVDDGGVGGGGGGVTRQNKHII